MTETYMKQWASTSAAEAGEDDTLVGGFGVPAEGCGQDAAGERVPEALFLFWEKESAELKTYLMECDKNSVMDKQYEKTDS